MNKHSYWQHILLFLQELIQGSTITTVFDALSPCTAVSTMHQGCTHDPPHDGQRIVYSSLLSRCMCACKNVCDIRRANDAHSYKC